MTHPMVVQLSEALQQAADPEKARGMLAHMKTEQPFYGVQAGLRRKLCKAVAREFKQITREAGVPEWLKKRSIPFQGQSYKFM